MKFGKTYINHQIPEWSDSYINYKQLKNIINQIVALQKDSDFTTLQNDLNSDYNKLISNFLIKLQMDIEVVDKLSTKKFNEYNSRLKRIFNNSTIKQLYKHKIDPTDHHSNIDINHQFHNFQNNNGLHTDQVDNESLVYTFDKSIDKNLIDKEELDEILSMLMESKSNFRNLKFFNDLNDRAVKKILKKFDKKCSTMERINFYERNVSSMEFVHINTEIDDCLEMNNNLIKIVYDYITEFVENSSSLFYLNKSAESSDNELNVSKKQTSNILIDLVKKDDAENLINELIYIYRSLVLIPSKTLISLLNKASILQCFKCIDKLLEIIPSLADSSDLNKRNFFHHHIIALGKTREQEKAIDKIEVNSGVFYSAVDTPKDLHFIEPFKPIEPYLVDSKGPDGINSLDKPISLEYILSKLPPHLRPSLLKKDIHERTPLHYAAQYGLVETTKIIIEALKKWNVWDSNVSIDDLTAWSDKDGLTPLHLAVLGHHPITVKTLWSHVNPAVFCQNPKLLHVAVNLNDPSLIEVLLSIKGIDINYRNAEKNNETAIYIAAKLNLKNAAECLLSFSDINVELKESMYGFTPLFIAAIEGFKEMVELLIYKGKASIRALDDSGFAPVEHAALRGFLEIGDLLKIDDDFGINNPVMTKEVRSQSPFGKKSQNNSTASLTNALLTTRPFYKKNISGNISSSNSSVKDDNILKPDRNIVSNVKTDELLTSVNDSRKKSKKLTKKELIEELDGSNSNENSLPPIDKKSLMYSNISNSQVFGENSTTVVKSVGNNSLNPDESFISITLGSNDTSKPVQAIKLNKIPFSKMGTTQLDTALSLSITCNASKDKTPVLIDLPVDETSNAINFKLDFNKDSDYVIYFDLVPTHQRTANDSFESKDSSSPEETRKPSINSNRSFNQRPRLAARASSASNGLSTSSGNTTVKNNKKILGRAVALLDSAKTRVGLNRRSLEDTITVPIISSSSGMEVLGSITMEVLIIQPFVIDYKQSSISNEKNRLTNDSYWKKLVTTRIVGHRGSGKNIKKNSLQLGENTMESFISASSLGASYVEFDVQLTKDHVPVIYHDFLVAESGVDIPMHELTLEQFLNLSETHKTDKTHKDDFELNGKYYSSEESRKMGLTKTFKTLNFKGNSRGSSIASSFLTLEEVFKKLPPNVGFNIECKYPMPDEATKEEMGQIVVEMNFWIDTVLDVVFKHCKDRDIIFSSFHPDICMMLSLKQPHFPILFLTEGGSSEMFDYRCLSLKNGINFANKWNLLGLVTAAKPIVMAPRLAQVVKSSGLVLFTYGVQNNDPDIAKKELRAGVDAVIVDNVLAIRKELTKDYFEEFDEKFED